MSVMKETVAEERCLISQALDMPVHVAVQVKAAAELTSLAAQAH